MAHMTNPLATVDQPYQRGCTSMCHGPRRELFVCAKSGYGQSMSHGTMRSWSTGITCLTALLLLLAATAINATVDLIRGSCPRRE
ncbi:hypothetical protein GGS26DRAFT_596518 [Hypomontagnella submonticulosa]|nr:hypothetical protein GGS26DRAFT_596518 [Hypomontagnella submonticulosa]